MSESQVKVLGLLEKNPDYLFRRHKDDFAEVQQLLKEPDSAEPAGSGISPSAIEWAIKTLHYRKKIDLIRTAGATYYGSYEAVKKASESRPGSELMRALKDLQNLGQSSDLSNEERGTEKLPWED